MKTLTFRHYKSLLTYGAFGKFVLIGFFASTLFLLLVYDADDITDFKLNIGNTNIATGYIVNIENTNVSNNGQRITKYFYNFSVGDDFYGSQSYSGDYYQMNDEVSIEYLPHDPDFSRILDGSKTIGGLFFTYLSILIFLTFLVLLIFRIIKIKKYKRIFTNGRIIKAEKIAVDATGATVNNRSVMKLTYQYEVNGNTHIVHYKTLDYEDFKNTERVVYNTKDPSESVLFASLPISVRRLIH